MADLRMEFQSLLKRWKLIDARLVAHGMLGIPLQEFVWPVELTAQTNLVNALRSGASNLEKELLKLDNQVEDLDELSNEMGVYIPPTTSATNLRAIIVSHWV